MRLYGDLWFRHNTIPFIAFKPCSPIYFSSCGRSSRAVLERKRRIARGMKFLVRDEKVRSTMNHLGLSDFDF